MPECYECGGTLDLDLDPAYYVYLRGDEEVFCEACWEGLPMCDECEEIVHPDNSIAYTHVITVSDLVRAVDNNPHNPTLPPARARVCTECQDEGEYHFTECAQCGAPVLEASSGGYDLYAEGEDSPVLALNNAIRIAGGDSPYDPDQYFLRLCYSCATLFLRSFAQRYTPATGDEDTTPPTEHPVALGVHELEIHRVGDGRPKCPGSQIKNLTPAKAKSFILCKYPYGLEVESSTARASPLAIIDSMPGCVVVGDSSVRGDQAGEVVTPPLNGDDSLELVERLYSIGLQFNRSCGLHLHMGVQGCDWRHLRKLAVLAKRIESDVFALFPGRQDNVYCAPIRAVDTTELISATDKESFLAIFFGVSERRLREYAKFAKKPLVVAEKYTLTLGADQPARNGKYCWFNIGSWFYRGTVEIRIHPGEATYEQVKQWIVLWQYLFAYAEQTPLGKIVGGPRLKAILDKRPKLMSYWLQRIP